MTDEAEAKAPAPLAFIDCETTSLDPEHGEVWEVAAIVRNSTFPGDDGEHVWTLPVDLTYADPVSLSIGRFHERHPCGNTVPDVDDWTEPQVFAHEFARITHGAHLVGAVVSFDEKRLERLLRAQGIMPSWHYHIQCVETLAVGWLRGQGRPAPELPWNSRELSAAIGVEMPTDEERHTALGDAKWAARIWSKIMDGEP